MRIIPTSIKFRPEQKKWLQTEASREGHGNVSRLIKAMVDRRMAATVKRVKTT